MNLLDRFSAVVFDLDGTLADSFPAIALSVNHVRARHGLPPLTVEEVKRHVGYGPGYLLNKTVPGFDPEADTAAYREHHPGIMVENTVLLPGAMETLSVLKRRGKRLGLCSNKLRYFSQSLLASLGIAQFFDAILGPEDVVHPKPAPDMLLEAMKRLGVTATDTLYVGDMTVDLTTGREAGATVWIVPTGSEERPVLERAKPDRLLENLHELATMALD